MLCSEYRVTEALNALVMIFRTTFRMLIAGLRHELKMRLNYLSNYLFLLVTRIRQKLFGPSRRMVFVTLLESIGDIVACEPVAREIKRRDPQCYLVWGVKKAFRELVDTNPDVDRTVVLHCLSERVMLARSGLFDQVVDLHLPERYCSLCRKPLLPSKRINNVVSLSNYFTFGSILKSFSQSAGLAMPDVAPRLHIPASAKMRVDQMNLVEPFVVIHCFSNAVEKDWPGMKWRKLCAMLSELEPHISVVEVGAKSIFGNDPPSGLVSLCGQLSLLESAEVIRRATLFVGIDSGPAHMANAVGTYGIILIGNYLGFDRFVPFSGHYASGENATLIHAKGSIDTISAQEVFQAASTLLTAHRHEKLYTSHHTRQATLI